MNLLNSVSQLYVATSSFRLPPARLKAVLATGAALVLLCGAVEGQTNFWTGDTESTVGSSTNQWSQAGNWSLGTVPNDSSINVEFGNFTGAKSPSNNTAIVVNNMAFTRTSGQATLRFFSSTLTANGTVSVTGSSGARFWGPGTFHAGDLSVTSILDFGSVTSGSTTSNSYAPTVVISGATSLSSTATLSVANLQGRTIHLGDLEMDGATVSLVAGSAADRGTVDGATTDIRVSSLDGSGTIRGSKVATEITTGSLTIDGGSSAIYTGTIINGNANNVVRLTRSGTGSQTLSGANAYSGGTVVSGGTLIAAHSTALGSGEVEISGEDEAVLRLAEGITIANAVTFSNSSSGSRLERLIGEDVSFSTGVGSFSSDFAGGTATAAALLAGSSGSATTLQFAFAVDSMADNDSLRLSDVFSLSGTGADLFVLELSVLSLGENAFLGWLDGTNLWVNAIEGNSGNNASGDQFGFSGSFADFEQLYGAELSEYVGAYGNDGAGSVWAVLNHNSDFAVIPEPAVTGLLIAGLSVLVLRRRLKRLA